jgi:membrane-associated phospholipid phosphatase
MQFAASIMNIQAQFIKNVHRQSDSCQNYYGRCLRANLKIYCYIGSITYLIYCLGEMKKTVIIFLSSLFLSNTIAQTDSLNYPVKYPFTLRNQLVPLGFITVGSLMNFGNIKYTVNDAIGNTTDTRIDNYLQYAPIAEMYLADACGVKHRNSVFHQTGYMFLSEIITSGIVQSIKYLTKVERPNGGTLSFPSGHTSNAFATATVLYHEFRETSPVIAYSGYSFAAATGILRMTNNKHWISDVLAGAGIGMLVTNMVYHFEPLKHWNPFVKKNFVLLPGFQYLEDGVMISVLVKI